MANEPQKASVGLPIGTRIGKYEVRERLAIGGQAIIYKCYDSLLDRLVAIKQVSSHLAEDPKFLERFRKEAQVLARLGARQPAIVSIFELIEDERGLFIVMEHVQGNTLETILQDNPQPIEANATLQILWRLAAALHDVHVAGIIHRDIKPANIIIGDGLRPKITDFGVAASLTGQTSMLLGTTRYMAPELLSGQHFDGRADMYSLGFIAYEMLAGREKFSEIFADILRDKHSEALRWMKWHSNNAVTAPPLHEINANIPKPLSDIVARMMDKDPEKRFENMEALGRAIKTDFSPRAKANAAAAAAAADAAQQPKRRNRRRPAGTPEQVVTQAHTMRHDDGDELVVQGPPTAPIPKKHLSRRTKLVLLATTVAVVVLGAMIALIVSTGRQNELASQRAKAYEQARVAYEEQGNYDRALAQFTEVRRRFPGSDEAAKAAVMIALTEAQIAVQDKDWKLAETKQEEAEKVRSQMHKVATGPMLDWTRDALKETDAFSKKRTTMQKYSEAVVKASDALKAGQFKDAAAIVVEAMHLELKEDQIRELRSLEKKIKVGEFRAGIEDAFKRGQALIADQKFEEADELYKQAAANLAADEAKVATKEEVLSKDDRKSLQDALNDHVRQLGVDRDVAKAMEDIAAAQAAGDLRAARDAMEKVLKAKPGQEDLTQKFNQLQAKISLADGQSYESQKKFAQAREKYVESLRFSENAEARAGLDRLKKGEDRSAKITLANTAFDSGDFAGALKLYDDAVKGGGEVDDAVKERVRECKYRIAMEEGNKFRDQKKFDESLKSYEEARSIKPEASAIIDESIGHLKIDQEYDGLLSDGNKAFKDGQWGKAIEQYSAAQKKKETEEVRHLLTLTRYSQSLALGKEALARPDVSSAVSYFKIALRYTQNDAEKKQVEDLIKQAEEQK